MNLAFINNIDTGPSFNQGELLAMLHEMSFLSLTEFRTIKYIMDICEKAAYANKVDPFKIKEAAEIGERVIRIIDDRLDME